MMVALICDVFKGGIKNVVLTTLEIISTNIIV